MNALRGIRVLIVEDEVLISMLLEQMLEEAGAEIVATLRNVRQAIHAARTLEYDIAIVDLKLSEEDASPVAEAVAARNKPLVIATGASLSDFANLPEHCVLAKPYTADDLFDACERALTQRPR